MSNSFDLLIVGGGVAGWTAATRAQQLGIRAVVVEKAAEGPGGGNGLLSGGIFHAAYLSPLRPQDDIYDTITRKTDGHSRPDVARAFADNVGRAFTLLEASGAHFERVGPAEFQSYRISPDAGPQADDLPQSPGERWLGKGGPTRLLTSMWQAFVGAGGDFMPGLRATELVVEDGGVVGVVAEQANGPMTTIRAKAVLLADGGFQANADLVHAHITPAYVLRGSEMDQGDALRMGLAVGAKAVDLDCFYGFVLCRDAMTNERLARVRLPGPQPFQLIDASIVVDGNGRRVADEDAGEAEYAFIDEPLANIIAKSETPGDCWVVFDHHVWETVGRTGRPDQKNIPMNPGLLDAGGTLLVEDTIEHLSDAMGLPTEALVDTVERFNRFCTEKVPITPPRGGAPSPIEVAPFYAVPLIAAVTFTMGGLLINGRGQVLSSEEKPIPGLYAAGGAMGGLQGGPHNGYAGGWSEASTFGMLAAESVAEQLGAVVEGPERKGDADTNAEVAS